MHPDKLPQKQHVKDWYDIISSDNGWSKSLRYDLQRLLADIHEQKNLENLCARLESNEPDTLNWLNKVIAFVFESNQSQLLSTEYAILPNQYGEFQLKTNLAKDEGIPEGLKDVLILLGEDWKKELLHLAISCTLEKTRNIRGISERISALITEKTSPNLREAAYLLISYIPEINSTKLTHHQDISVYRRKIWEFAASLDKDNVPEIKTLSDWTPSLWNICDEWILKTLIGDIAQLKKVSQLQTTLETETELETVDWLSNFISFLRASKKESLCSEQPIFPNQLGIFKKKAELLFDKNIPEQLKDVLELFGSPCRGKLLHRNILGYNTSIEQLRVSDVSKQINDIIRDKTTNQSHEFKSAIYNLISLFSTTSKEQNRFKIWQYARDIYADIIPEKVFIDNLDDFSWKECNTWIITRIVEEVEEAKNLDCLADLLLFNKEDTISWLNNLLCLPTEDFSDPSSFSNAA
ncbi:MAG: hypothetical protein KME29_31905 [Calothrix sp. FI2-JRJ7]|jgi:hypothetical protein|nr:hypothetical protein [Calothrix sp. FI2-JRJ7]